ncbi:MAG TPA: L,D-transpeptidase family protein [Dongiaceae bacterium]|jgi:murein L,D-transpeptidase YcbB/YkuD|nr:L,D-transpeptidase family protein [Dongiaceae bacterium]
MRRLSSRIAALVPGALLLAAAAGAHADTADRFLESQQSAPAEVPELPQPVPAAVPGIAAELDALKADPAMAGLAVDWEALKAYYAAHQDSAIWTHANGFSIQGQAWIAQIPLAVTAGLPLAQQTLLRIGGMTAPADTASQTRDEALMSAVFVGSAVEATGPLGDPRRRGAAILDVIATAKDPGSAMSLQWPGYYRFWKLYADLAAYEGYYQAGGWPSVPKVDKLEPGKSDAIVPALRARLQYTGELAAAARTDNEYDPDLAAAVELFQRHHGLNDDGVVGGRTLEELNVSAEMRLKMILLNLERMRQQADKFEPRHLIVNIPAQEAKVIDNGKVAFWSKAIVGKIDRKTPTLDSVIKIAKFNPEWNAPAKIASNDEVRRARADPNFLTDKGFHVYDLNGMEVDPQQIDWHSVGPGNFPYRLVQQPGPENALGPVKLDFPNPESVYLHGTNQKELFARQDRYFSSGCMRLQRPIDMAAFLLQDDPDWQRPRIDQVVEAGKTVLVPLKTPMPIHVVYMTAWVDEEGVMQFRKDMYRYDKYPDIPADLKPATAGAGLVASNPQPAKLGKSN